MSFESERLFRFIRIRAVVTIADILQRGPAYTRQIDVANCALAELADAGLIDDFPGNNRRKPRRPRLVQIRDTAMRLPPTARVAPPCRKFLCAPWTSQSSPRLEWRKLPNGKCKRRLAGINRRRPAQLAPTVERRMGTWPGVKDARV